ncbi:MAG: RIP metalloprotease RseP [Gammaproteobacteria bacterium]
MNVLISLLAFLVAVAVLIAFHEFGHYSVARLLGVKVQRYSIGFGKVLLAWRPRSGIEYAISAIPLGGYVKLLDEREGDVPEAERHRAFNRQPIWRRAAILLAGPGFNFLFAIIAYWIVYMAGIPGIKPVVGPVTPHSPVAVAGLQEKDTIIAVNGSATPTWQAVRIGLLSSVVDDRPLRLQVQQIDGERRTARIHYGDSKALLAQPSDLLDGLGLAPWAPPLAVVLDQITPDGPAAHAGLQSGDTVLAVDGQPVANWTVFQKQIRAHPGRRLEFTVVRNEKRLQVPVVPASIISDGKRVGHVGAGVVIPSNYGQGLIAYMRFGPLDALGEATARTGQITALTAVMVYRMVIGQASLSNLSGPIGIAHYAGAWAQAGLISFLFFLALISISLGFVNLLPIPLLDGGQLFYLVIEAIRRKPLSEYAEAIGQRVGLSLIVLLVGFAVFNDLSRLVHS